MLPYAAEMGAPDPKLPVTIGELVGGKYVIEHVVGSGGMGVVVAARHVQLEQRVALKFLHSQVLSSEQAVTRFLREAKATVRLKSDHVARVYDVDTLPSGAPYAVMELLEGVDLAAYARENGPLRIADAVEFVVQACEGIVEAHALGIVHRDLKPQNLFVTRRVNGSHRIKVLDFGISKSIGGTDLSLTDSTVVLGSPLYMSPEQMKASRNVDVRSDVWSLGVILYELLTGTVPFNGESITELCLKVVTAPPAPPRTMRAEIPEALAKVVLRCLEKDVNLRFPSVAALAEALEPFSAGAERGITDRTWRSLVETSDALDRRSIPDATPAPPAASTNSTWDKPGSTEPPPSLRRGRGFYRGLFAGVALAAIVGVGTTVALVGSRAPSIANTPPTPPSNEARADQSASTVVPVSAASPTVEVLALQSSSVAEPIVKPTAALPRKPVPNKNDRQAQGSGRTANGVTVAAKPEARDAGAAFQTTANGAPILP